MNMNLRLEPEWPVPNSASIQSEQAIRIINRKQQKSTTTQKRNFRNRRKAPL